MEIGDFVNDLLIGGRLPACDEYLVEEELAAPIDIFWERLQEIIRYGDSSRLQESKFLGRLLVLGVVSAAEAYFRRIIGLCIDLCPIARSCATEKTVNLGGLLWHNSLDLSRSAFENYSMASSKELIKISREFLSFDMNNRDFKDSLKAFDDICQLRHGIVHNDGLLPGKNAVILQVPTYNKPVRIIIKYAQLQDIAAATCNLVSLYNRKLFEEMCERWAIKWRRRSDWSPLQANVSFEKVYSAFSTNMDIIKVEEQINSEINICKQAVERRYAIV